MVAIVHMLVGATIGAVIDNPAAVWTLAFFSHYVLDYIPHIDAETFASRKLPYSWNQLAALISDTILTLTVITLFYFTHERRTLILIGTFASMLPDLLMPLEKYVFMVPFQRLHTMFHWNPRRAQRWSWYVTGLAMPVAVGIISSVILWNSF